MLGLGILELLLIIAILGILAATGLGVLVFVAVLVKKRSRP